MNVLYGESDAVAAWVAERTCGMGQAFDENQSFGVVSKGVMIGGVVCHNWSPEHETIEVSVAATSPKWATRSILSELFKYPFGFCRMVLARHSETNTRARRFWAAIGADEHIIPGLYGQKESGCIVTFSREQWAKSRFNNGSI